MACFLAKLQTAAISLIFNNGLEGLSNQINRVVGLMAFSIASKEVVSTKSTLKTPLKTCKSALRKP